MYIVLPVALCGSETWSLIVMEEHRLRCLLHVMSTQFMCKFSKCILLVFYNMFWPFRPSSGKSFYIYTQLFLLFSPLYWPLFTFWGEVIWVVYSINASRNSYANLKCMVKINYIKIKSKYNIVYVNIQNYTLTWKRITCVWSKHLKTATGKF
jgi:hypothetical protein